MGIFHRDVLFLVSRHGRGRQREDRGFSGLYHLGNLRRAGDILKHVRADGVLELGKARLDVLLVAALDPVEHQEGMQAKG
ncbi:hypothetical protein BB934_35545 (plasmid) [Microvirga ossetica]|uniref:Uncharacterized protein n=1 Tax=Microvirga ossetica TaxID=1882682 RepID=A0A1B2EUC2_9HYPH|nr:hypothetical protein BB934_35545 [Microvirga ossetica]